MLNGLMKYVYIIWETFAGSEAMTCIVIWNPTERQDNRSLGVRM